MVLATLALALIAQSAQASPEPLAVGVYQLQIRALQPLVLTPSYLPEPLLGPRPRRLGWGWYAFAGGGQLADAITTTRFRAAGQIEGNRRMRGIVDRPVPFYSLKVGAGLVTTALADLACSRAERDGRRWTRHAKKVVPIVMGVYGFGAAIHNERALARGR